MFWYCYDSYVDVAVILLFVSVIMWWCCWQIKQVWMEAPIEGGMLDYLKFVKIIKRGKNDD